MGLYQRDDSPFWWMALERPGGRPLRKSTKIHVDAPSPDQRKELKQQATTLYLAEQGALVLQKRGLGPKPAITVTKYLDWYRTHVTAHKRGAERELEVLKMLTTAFGALQLADLTRERILEWRTARAADHAPATVNRELDVLKHALAQAVPTYLEASPIARLKRLHAPSTEAHVLPPAAEAKLLAALKPADRVVVIAALDTLLRASSLLELKWAQVHGAYWTILNPKTGTPFKVPVSRRLQAALATLGRRRGGYVFAHRRRASTARLRANSLKQMLEDGCRRAKVKYGRGRGITFHALRHTGASRMIAAGVDLRTVQELGGWSSLRMLTRYLHPTAAQQRAAVEAVGQGVSVNLT